MLKALQMKFSKLAGVDGFAVEFLRKGMIVLLNGELGFSMYVWFMVRY